MIFLRNARRTMLLLALVAAVIGFLGCKSNVPDSVAEIRNIKYARASDRWLRLDIYRPKVMPAEKLPVLVWIFGGGWQSGSKDFCPVAFIATQQVAVVSINYRLDKVAPFPAQIYDCKGVIRWLRANADKYHLDADHIGVTGVSAGGHLALLLATTPDDPKMEGDVGGNPGFSSRIQCACAFYPPTDLNGLVTDPAERRNPRGIVGRLLGGPVADHVDQANFASPLFHVSTNCAPVFLVHGSLDQVVPVDQSIRFYQAVKKAGVDARLEIIPGGAHGLIAPPEIVRKIQRFFQQYLREQPPSEIAQPKPVSGGG